SKGLVEEVEGKIVYVGDEAFFVMTLNHLSTYAVVDGETADKAIEKSNATIKAGVKATKITKAKALVKKGKVTLTWKKTAGYKVDGYQILKSTKKTSGFKTVKTTKLQKSTITKGLTKGKTYYFKVRGYRVVDGKTVYTKWSKVKVKAK
ncbi:MAG TPA: fibronectin type III domain-containing protein, partial [Anaerovoracaceae bacterium]|nr:fibronectin type III domain-containing protein [Anaerovoracaceae bacterium]